MCQFQKFIKKSIFVYIGVSQYVLKLALLVAIMERVGLNSGAVFVIFILLQVLCASNGDHTVVEPITPPEGAKVGECVSFSGYVREIWPSKGLIGLTLLGT